MTVARAAMCPTLAHLDRTAPQTSPKAYEAARTALQGSEELTFTDHKYRHLSDP